MARDRSLFSILTHTIVSPLWFIFAIFYAIRARKVYVSIREGTMTINRSFVWTGSLAGTTTIRFDDIQRTRLNGSGSKLFIDLEGKDPITIRSRFLRKQDRKALLELLPSLAPSD